LANILIVLTVNLDVTMNRLLLKDVTMNTLLLKDVTMNTLF